MTQDSTSPTPPPPSPPNQQALRERVHALLHRAAVSFQEYQHEPVFDYETAAAIRARFGLTGTESKSLFLRGKNGVFAMYITLEGRRADLKAAARVLDTKLSVATDEELTAQTGCLPKCACPFGHPAPITMIIDPEILKVDKFIFCPGPPERTIEISGSHLPAVLQACREQVRYLPESSPSEGSS